MLGHVTSSYHSPALGRPFALALVADGRARIGETQLAAVGEDLVPVEVADPSSTTPKGPGEMAEPTIDASAGPVALRTSPWHIRRSGCAPPSSPVPAASR